MMLDPLTAVVRGQFFCGDEYEFLKCWSLGNRTYIPKSECFSLFPLLERPRMQQNLFSLWSVKDPVVEKKEEVIGDQRKVSSHPQPLKSGRVLSFDDLCKNSGNTLQKPSNGIPTCIKQWFSLLFTRDENGSLCSSYNWTKQPTHLLFPFDTTSIHSPSIYEDDIEDIIEEDDICSLLAIMDHLEDSATPSSNPTSKRKASNLWEAFITLSDQAENRKHRICVQTNFCPQSRLLLFSFPNRGERNSEKAIPILKSALQKNVRRCRPYSAVRIALQLMILDFSQFIRRICIICLEDAVLHPNFPLIVWLMMTSNHGYNISSYLLNQLLQFTFEISSIPFRDPLPRESLPFPSFDDLDVLVDREKEFCLLRCLLARGSYGGMAGDIKMMQQYSSIWLSRFQFPSMNPLPLEFEQETWIEYVNNIYTPFEVILDYRDVQKPTLEDFPCASVDFHCTSIVESIFKQENILKVVKSQMETILEKKMSEQDVVGTIKKLMWHHRSSVTLKKLILPSKNEETAKDEILKDFFLSYSKEMDSFSRKRIRWVLSLLE